MANGSKNKGASRHTSTVGVTAYPKGTTIKRNKNGTVTLVPPKKK